MLEDVAGLQGNLLLRGVDTFQGLQRLPGIDDKTALAYLDIEGEKTPLQDVAYFARQGLRSPEHISTALAQMRELFPDLLPRVQALAMLRQRGVSSVEAWMQERWGFVVVFNWEKDSTERMSTAEVRLGQDRHQAFKALLRQTLSRTPGLSAVLHLPVPDGSFYNKVFEVHSALHQKAPVHEDLATARQQANTWATLGASVPRLP